MVLIPSFLLSPSRKCLLPPFQTDSAISSLKLSDPRAALSISFQQVPNYSVIFFTLSHTALLTLKLAKPMMTKTATDPILKLEAGSLSESHNL